MLEAEEARMRTYATTKEADLLLRRDREESRFNERQVGYMYTYMYLSISLYIYTYIHTYIHIYV